MIVVLKGKANGSNFASQVNLILLKDPSVHFRRRVYLFCLVQNRAKSGVVHILLSSLSKQRQVDFCELEADSFISKVKKKGGGAGKIAQQLRALATFPEVAGPILSTNITVYNSSSRGSDSLLWFLRAPSTHMLHTDKTSVHI